MVYLHWATCQNLNHQACELYVPNYVKIIIIIILLNLILRDMATHHLPLSNDQNNHLLITCDNTYIMESKDELSSNTCFCL